LDSTFDPVHYSLQGITRPAFFEKNDDEYTVYRDGDDDNDNNNNNNNDDN
jgi:hypothetical protein